MIKKYVSLSDQSNIDEKMAKLYEYTCDVIKMCSKDYSPPKELPITDIFERFVRILHHKNSLLARDVLLSALDHSKNGHYHDQHSIYLCFKGLGANYVKLADRRSGYINDDNADTEIDACYQLAINYFKKALEFSKNQVLENVDNRYCFLMLSISNVRLAAHYQHLYAKFCHANLLAQIEHWYREAIRWAHEANDRRKAGIGYNQLAHHFYSQGLMREAINHWQLAIDNLISDLEAHPDVPFQLISMKTAYQQNTHALHPDDPRYIDFCSRLAKDLIDLGHALKAREMSSFYQTSPRQTQSVSEDHNSQSFLTRATMIGRK